MSAFTWKSPEAFWLLLLVPLVGAWSLWTARNRVAALRYPVARVFAAGGTGLRGLLRRALPLLRMAAVAAPGYLERHGSPSTPHDLAHHACINLRLATLGGLYAWEFEKNGRRLNVRVDGQLIFNKPGLVVAAAEAGFGLAFVPDDHVAEGLRERRLMRVLEDWCPPYSGYHLFYPSRRQASAAFALVVEALRYRK